MDFLATPLRRRILFAALYLSEGAPIGFLWLALPTRLRLTGVPVEQITRLTALLVIPWTLKFVWAPLVDLLRSDRWSFKHWVISAQAVMGLTLLPIVWINFQAHYALMTILLLMQAFAAATQDVAIDALCISVTDIKERGQLNGWMQAGVLVGRASMGGGALLLVSIVGDAAVVVILVCITTFSGGLLLMSRLPDSVVPVSERTISPEPESLPTIHSVWTSIVAAFSNRTTWLGLVFAFTGPAAFKAFEVVIGPFLIDRAYTETEIGQFTAVVMIGAMVAGSLLGGLLADRFGRRQFVAGTLLFVIACISSLAISDAMAHEVRGIHLPILMGCTAFGIGLFTVAAYAMFMDLTRRDLAATQFSAFMAATNGCEAWSTFCMGLLVARSGYPTAMLVLCAASILSLPLLAGMRRSPAL